MKKGAALVTRYGIQPRKKSRLNRLFKTVFVLFVVDRTRIFKRDAYRVSADISANFIVSYRPIPVSVRIL